MLSFRTQVIAESPTFKIMAQAAKLKQQGKPVIVLAAGEPDFNTPEHIRQAGINAINNGLTKYTPAAGSKELKDAIVAKFKRENNLDYTTDEIIVSCGGKHSIYNILQALLNSDDEVIIPAPYWVSYPDMVLLGGGKPVIVPCSIEESFKLTPEKLRQALNKNTKAIFLNSPSNPTGMVYSDSELIALGKVLIDYPQVLIISDDLYEHLLFDNQPFKNIANLVPELFERTLIVNGVSKAYAMTGWRIGYTASKNKQLIKAMDTIQSQSTSNPCSISQHAATIALNGGIDCVKPMLREFISRHDYVVERLNNIAGIRCLKAQGAFYAFFDCRQAIANLVAQGKITENNDLAFADYLLNKFFVAGVPGSAFGLDKYMRISFATSMSELTEGLNRLEQALSSN